LENVSEAEFQAALLAEAVKLGWDTLWVRRCQHGRGAWVTDTRGTLGKGWVDVTLIRGARIIFAELKRNGAHPDDDQLHVHDVLAQTPAEVHVWRPADWPLIKLVLA
jgi:hypothetical protein